MRNYKNTHIAFFFSIAVIIGFLIVVYVGWTFKLDNAIHGNKEVIDFNSGWYLEQDGLKETDLSLPYIKQAKNEDTITYYNEIPKDIKEQVVLCLESSHQLFQAYINESLIFEYGTIDGVASDNAVGNVWVMIEIPKEAAGQKIAIKFSNLPYNKSRLSKTTLGSKSATILFLLKKNFGIILFCGLTFLMSVLFFIAAFLMKKWNLNFNYFNYIYLGVFVFLAALWTLTDSRILQFVVGNTAVIYLISFISFMLLPIPFLLFVKDNCGEGKRLLSLLCSFYIVNFFVSLTLYLFNVTELYQTLFITHILILISIISIIRICFWEWRKHHNKGVRGILLALVSLALCSIVALVEFYYVKDQENTQFFRYGIIIFILFLSGGTFHQSVSLLRTRIKEQDSVNVLFDELTQMKNFTAFHMEMDKLKSQMPSKSIAFVVFDINNLKGMNQLHGFHAGDELLKCASECIRNAFSSDLCFRMKSDEFAVVVSDRELDDIETGIGMIEDEIYAYNQRKRDKIDLYYGISMKKGEFDATILYSLFHEANSNMYYNRYQSNSKKQRLFLV